MWQSNNKASRGVISKVRVRRREVLQYVSMHQMQQNRVDYSSQYVMIRNRTGEQNENGERFALLEILKGRERTTREGRSQQGSHTLEERALREVEFADGHA